MRRGLLLVGDQHGLVLGWKRASVCTALTKARNQPSQTSSSSSTSVAPSSCMPSTRKLRKASGSLGRRAATSCPFRNRAMRMARARHHCHRCSPPCSSNKKTWALSTPPRSFPSLHCSLKSFRLICSEPKLRVFSSGERCGSTQDGHPAISLLRFGG